MARNKQSAEVRTCRLGPEIVRLHTRKAGAIPHRLDRRLMTRNAQEARAMEEQNTGDTDERIW
jgi:hypothetical protein